MICVCVLMHTKCSLGNCLQLFNNFTYNIIVNKAKLHGKYPRSTRIIKLTNQI